MPISCLSPIAIYKAGNDRPRNIYLTNGTQSTKHAQRLPARLGPIQLLSGRGGGSTHLLTFRPVVRALSWDETPSFEVGDLESGPSAPVSL